MPHRTPRHGWLDATLVLLSLCSGCSAISSRPALLTALVPGANERAVERQASRSTFPSPTELGLGESTNASK